MYKLRFSRLLSHHGEGYRFPDTFEAFPEYQDGATMVFRYPFTLDCLHPLTLLIMVDAVEWVANIFGSKVLIVTATEEHHYHTPFLFRYERTEENRYRLTVTAEACGRAWTLLTAEEVEEELKVYLHTEAIANMLERIRKKAVSYRQRTTRPMKGVYENDQPLENLYATCHHHSRTVSA